MNFIKWLCQDIRRTLKDELNKLFKSDKAETVIKDEHQEQRWKKPEEFGPHSRKDSSLKVYNRFGSYVARLNPHLILNAFSENSAYIRLKKLVMFMMK